MPKSNKNATLQHAQRIVEALEQVRAIAQETEIVSPAYRRHLDATLKHVRLRMIRGEFPNTSSVIELWNQVNPDNPIS